jgi:hypothetical protein
MALMNQHVPHVLAWLDDILPTYRTGLMALAALAAASWPIRRVVHDGRLGPVVSHRVPATVLWVVAVAPVAFWLWSIWAAYTQGTFFLSITGEDTLMEYGQVLLLGFASLIAAWLARSLWKQQRRVWAVGYVVLTLALFWAAGEEISWGQRLLHLSTPAWFQAHNVQHEMNLHNLGNTDGKLSGLTDVALSWIVFVSAALWVTGVHRIERLRSALWLPHPSLIPALCCVISFWEVTVLYTVLHPEATQTPAAVEQLQEPREAILYFSILAFLLIARSSLRTDKAITGSRASTTLSAA